MLTPLLFMATLSPLTQCSPMGGHRHDPAPMHGSHEGAPRLNARCPVMGDPVTAESPIVSVGNRSYAVCCPSCGSKLKADPAKYLDDQGVPINAKPEDHGPHGTSEGQGGKEETTHHH